MRILNGLLFLCSGLLMFFSSGCTSTTPLAWQDESIELIWPAPPDRARVRYLRSLTGPEDFKAEDKSSRMFRWWFGEEQLDLSLHDPFAVAASATDQVWVADSGTRMIYVIDMGQRKVNYFQEFDSRTLVSPSGIALDESRQRVYVADAAYKQVFVLDYQGNYLESLGPPQGFQRPAGIAVSPTGQILVADVAAGLAFVFAPDGTFVKQVGSKVNSDGRFRKPLNVAFGPENEVLVLDTFSFHVEVQDDQGALLGTIGQLGDAAGYLARPKGLAVDPDGHVYISDAAFDNIQVFDMAGNLLTFWGGAGRAPGSFNLPAGLFIDSQRRLFVADSYNHRVQAYQLLP